MGFFDTVYCDYALPNAEVQREDFQTKDLGENLETYRITSDGRLCREDSDVDNNENTPSQQDVNFHGSLRFYTSLSLPCDPPILVFSEDSDDNAPEQAQGKIVESEWYEYQATFIEGTLTEIMRVAQEPSSFHVTHLLDLPDSEMVDITTLSRGMIQNVREGNRRIILPKKKPKNPPSYTIADIPSELLDKIKKLRLDRFIEKHEGPWEWESFLKYDDACLVHLKAGSRAYQYTVLMPFAARHKATFEEVLCTESSDMLTLFFVCPSLAGMEGEKDNRRWSSFCAICREVPAYGLFEDTTLYVAILLHEVYLSEPEMGDNWAFRQVFR